MGDRRMQRFAAPNAPLKKAVEAGGPLVDLAAADADLVEALRLFAASQARRHRADYDHEARFDLPLLRTACRDAANARDRLATASASSREALFALLTVRRSDFRERA